MVINKIYYIILLITIAIPNLAQAIPAFARKTNLSCSNCHSAWPALNSMGRSYKEHGYRFTHNESPNKIISPQLSWDEKFPLSVLIVSRPYDKKKSAQTKNRSLHEIELIAAGVMSNKVSGFIEIEAEDEELNSVGFAAGIPRANLTYSLAENTHLQFSWDNIVGFDPYNSYSNHLKLTVKSNAIISQNFGGADNGNAILASRQNVTLYSRIASDFFMGISYSGDSNDPQGASSDTLSSRIAWDINSNVTIGMLAINGSCGPPNCLIIRAYTRTIFDIQAELGGITINSAHLQASDDNTDATIINKNNASYIQGFYSHRVDSHITWVPLIRYDFYEINNKPANIRDLTISLNYYNKENIRTMLEYWSHNSEVIANNDNRITLQIYAAF